MVFDAFISYSHTADGEIGPAVEHGLERLARPWYRLRALTVFRDQADLPLTEDLWNAIAKAIDSARFFVLLVSPESARSEWVNREVAHWCSTKSPETLLLVLTGGELDWDKTTGDFTAASAVPATLRGHFAGEPLWLDLRWAREEPEPSLRLPKFRAAMALLASPMRGVPPDALEGEDIRLHRRARRLARAAVASLAVLTVAATVAAFVAVANARRADREARVAVARQVGLEAIDLPASKLDRAFLLSLASADLDAGAGSTRFRASRTLIGRFSRLERLIATGSPRGLWSVWSLTAAADGTLAASVLHLDPRGTTRTEILRWGPGEAQPERQDAPVGVLAFVGDGSRALVLEAEDGTVLVGHPDAPPVALEGTVAAMDTTNGRAVLASDGAARLVDLHTGATLAELATDGPVVSTLEPEVAVVAAGRRLMVLDSRTGAMLAESPLAAPPSAAAASESGRQLITVEAAGPSAALRLWHREGARLVPVGDPVWLPDGSGAVRRIVLSPDLVRALVVTDRDALVVSTNGAESPALDEGGAGPVAVDRSGRYAAVGGRRLAVWDLVSGQRRIAVPEPVAAVAWGGNCEGDSACVLATVGRTVDLWDPVRLTTQRLAPDTNAQTVAVAPDGVTVSTAGWGPDVALWRQRPQHDTGSREELAAECGPTRYDVPAGILARVVGETVELSRPPDSRAVHRLAVGPVDRVFLLAESRRLLGVSAGAVQVWETRSGRRVPMAEGCPRTVADDDLLAVSTVGGTFAVFRQADHVVMICDATSGALRAIASVAAGIPERVDSLAVDADGSVVLGIEGGSLARYAIAEGNLHGARIGVGFGGRTVRVQAVALAGGRVAAGLVPVDGGLQPGQVLVWDVAGDGEPIVFEVDESDVLDVALLGQGGDLVAVAGRARDGTGVTITVWESATRRRFGRPLTGLDGRVSQLTGNQRAVVAVDAAGRTVRWRLDDDPRRELCEIVGRALRRDEWDAAAGGALRGRDFRPECARAHRAPGP